MGFFVPNAEDAIATYTALDQAEPDSLDFEILGNLGRSFVFSGGAVSVSDASHVAVTAASLVIDGKIYSVATVASLALPTAPINNRFDLIIARAAGSSASVITLTGVDSASNPKFPQSRTVAGVFVSSLNYDPDTDVVLAAVYRVGATGITSHNIIDKRCLGKTVVTNQGSSTPATTATSGSLYYRTTPASDQTKSGVFVGTTAGAWVELAAQPTSAGPFMPVGAVVGWPSSTAVPTGYLEASGQSLSTSAYSDLFAVYGYTHGGSGALFTLPNYNEMILRGTTSTVLVTSAVTGSDTITLTTNNLPSHAHTITDVGHNHAQDPHTHTQQPHSHALNNGNTQTTFVPASGLGIASLVNTSATVVATAVNDAATATNQTNTARLTTTNVIGGGVALDNRQASKYVRWILRAL